MFNSLTTRFTGTRGGAVMLGVAAAVLAAILLLVYMSSYRDSVNGDNAQTPVLVAKALIPKGTPGAVIGTKQLYQGAEFKKKDVLAGALADPAYLNGRVAVADILPGQQLTAADFTTATTNAINTKITGKQRAISVSLDNVHGSLSELKPGDHVDVYIGLGARGQNGQALVKLFRQNVLVMAVPGKQSSANISGTSEPSGNLILRVNNEKDAAAFAYAADNTQLWFVLRPQSGASKTTPATATVDTLLR
jgi:Flp pilus assembly protein CpaB